MTTHASPADGSALTGCCHTNIDDLPAGDRIITRVELVDCPGHAVPQLYILLARYDALVDELTDLTTDLTVMFGSTDVTVAPVKVAAIKFRLQRDIILGRIHDAARAKP